MERLRIWMAMKGLLYLKLLWMPLLMLFAYLISSQMFAAPLLLLVVATLVISIVSFLHHKPHERLNEYFVTKTFRFSKYQNIYQSINRNHTKAMPCDKILNDITRTSLKLAKKLPPGHYRTITHKSIIERLQKAYTCNRVIYLGRRSLRITVYELMFPRCIHKCWWCCEKRKTKKDFYYIEFSVLAEEENRN